MYLIIDASFPLCSSPTSSLISIVDNPASDMPVIHITSSSVRPAKSVESPSTYRSDSIKRLLTHEKTRYRVECNPSKRATALCWKVFGLPAVLSNENENKFEIITGFASCKTCFETYRYIDSSTANLNSHVCPRQLPSTQSKLFPQSRTPRSMMACKLLTQKKKEMTNLCARWAADSMRPFSIITDRGFREIIDKSIEIGKVHLFSFLIVSFFRRTKPSLYRCQFWCQ